MIKPKNGGISQGNFAAKKTDFVAIDYKLRAANQATISIFERGFLFGDGFFETCQIWENRILNFTKHKSRMMRSLEILRFPTNSIDFVALEQAIEKLIAKNQISKGLLRVSVSRGQGSNGYLPKDNSRPLVVMQTMPNRELPAKIVLGVSNYLAPNHFQFFVENCTQIDAKKQKLSGQKLSGQKLSGQKLSGQKLSGQKLSGEAAFWQHGIKSMNSLPYILNKIEAAQRNLFDLIMLDAAGFVCETSSANIFWVKNGKIFTVPDESPIVHGCTRSALCEIKELGVKKIAAQISDLIEADELFLTNAASLVIAVDELVMLGAEGEIRKKFSKKTTEIVQKILRLRIEKFD